MYNKKLYEEICNVTCTWEDLETFCTLIDENEFDLDNSFEKYYNLNSITTAIEKYEHKQITADYLAYWTNAYNWILMANEWNADNYINSSKFKMHIREQISELLDALSFFDEESKRYYKLKKYKKEFVLYDKLYKEAETLDIWEWPITDICGEDFDFIIAINHSEQNYTKLFDEMYIDIDMSDNISKKSLSEIESKINELHKNGYKELKF